MEYCVRVLLRPPHVFVDYHGHSRRKNVFLFGCSRSGSWSAADRALSTADEHIQYLVNISRIITPQRRSNFFINLLDLRTCPIFDSVLSTKNAWRINVFFVFLPQRCFHDSCRKHRLPLPCRCVHSRSKGTRNPRPGSPYGASLALQGKEP